MTHCLQFNYLGLWKSNPVAEIPDWKWEGYAEYLSRQHADQKDLKLNISRLQRHPENTWEITLDDNTIAPRNYYEYWILVQYCLDVKKFTYRQLLNDTTSEQLVSQEMLNWYEFNKKQNTAIVLK